MPRTIYLIDGFAHVYRAYYAPFANLTAPSGEPTRATHVFIQMVLNILRDRRPDFLAVVLDVSDETVFRKDFFPEYKAHREPPPEDLPIQRDRIFSILESVGVPLLRLPGFEADDLMATLGKRFAAAGDTVVFVSKDKDLEQCLSDRVSMYDPAKDEMITPQRLIELKGWPPEKAIDAQCLIGDSVDNVPGVKGIGPKTAAKLLEKYGTVEGVIAHADELTPKQGEAVKAFAPQLDVTRRLVTLRDDVPFEFDLAAAEISRFNWDAARPIFAELGMRRLVEMLPGGRAAGSGRAPPRPDSAAARTSAASLEPPPAPPSLFDAAEDGGPASGRSQPATVGGSAPARPAARDPLADRAAPDVTAELLRRAADLKSPPVGPYRLVQTSAELDDLVQQLASAPAFSLDTETTGVHPIDADLVGISLSWRPGEGCYLPLMTIFGDPLPKSLVIEKLGPLLADAGKLKIGHHIKYDLNVLRNAGLPVGGPLFDTMIASFVVEPLRLSFSLDRVVQQLFGYEMIPITDLIGKGRDQLRMDQVALAHVTEYAGADADYALRLYQVFDPVLRDSQQHDLFYNVEMPLVRVLADMEFDGVNLDADFLAEMGREMGKRIDALADEATRLAGTQLNLDSPKQLAELLFDKRGLRVVRRTQTARSTDAETLETLARETDDPLPKVLLDYRELQKLRSTYIDALPKARSRRTHRIHTSFHQTGAITGRLSSSEPNLQNIPIRTEIGRQIRRAFVPRTPADRLIVADYSQVELRVLAHFSGDEALIAAFVEDRDIHAFVAAQVNGVPLDQVTGEMRSRAKAVNFGIIYGQTAHGLAMGTGMSRAEAQQFIDDYFRRYPRIRGFIDQCILHARERGFVETMLGRRRPIVDIDSRNRMAKAQAERLAVNTVIQGSAADLIKLAMNALHARIAAETLPLRLLLQVHDELVCESPAGEADAMSQVVAETMRQARPMRVPLKVDVATADNWLEAK